MSDRNSNHIRTSIDCIEPAEGAKARMFENIKHKAATQTAKPETAAPKPEKHSKLVRWVLPIAACFAVVILGVTLLPRITQTPSIDNPGVENTSPFLPVNDANAFLEILNIDINAPEGAENVEYTIIDNEMADIVFDYDGQYYTLRASRERGDFSGLSGTQVGTEQIDSKNDAIITTLKNGYNTYIVIRWTDGAVTYILINTDGATIDDMKEIYTQVK